MSACLSAMMWMPDYDGIKIACVYTIPHNLECTREHAEDLVKHQSYLCKLYKYYMLYCIVTCKTFRFSSTVKLLRTELHNRHSDVESIK